MVAVIGAGVMGAGIAQSLAVAGYRVRLFDTSADALDGGMRRIEHGRFGLARAAERGKLSPADAWAARARPKRPC